MSNNGPQYDADDILDWMGDDHPTTRYPSLAYEVVLDEEESREIQGELPQTC